MRTARKTKCIFCGAGMVATDDDPLPLCEGCTELKQLIDLSNGFLAGEFTINGLNHYEVAGLNADGSEVEEGEE